MGRNLQDITGQHFGLWTVVGPYEIRNRLAYWYCRCDCGAEKWVRASSLKGGNSISCGCVKSKSCGCVKSNTVQNLTGQRFGLWTVVGPREQRNGVTYWYCRCDCGTEKWVYAGSLITGSSKSCGCVKSNTVQNLTGQRFGLWTVVGPYEIRNGHAYWYCRCDCGAEKWVRAGSLKGGNSISCGCAKPTAFQDLTGQRFGLWTVVGPYEIRNGHAYWYCRCDCGIEKWVKAGDLKNRSSASCGCAKPTAFQDLTGQHFGLWTVIGPHERYKGGTRWLCRCDCGNEKWVYARSLTTGKSKSCCHKKIEE